MINAIVESKNGVTAIIEITGDISDLYCQLSGANIEIPVSRIKLVDDEDAEICAKLYADSDIGNHMTLLFTESDSLEDVNFAVAYVKNSDERIRDELEQAILYDQYGNVDELRRDIRQMTYDLGDVTETFYFPLTGHFYDADDAEDIYDADGRTLSGYSDLIADAFRKYTYDDEQNMAAFYTGMAKDKVLLADWSFEVIDDVLYGKVDVRLTEALTADEENDLKDWIIGQNADGLGEGFEQQNIEVGDDIMYVSFWNSGDDYFVHNQTEMDEYTGQQPGQRMEGM